jgi:hypothetical protein
MLDLLLFNPNDIYIFNRGWLRKFNYYFRERDVTKSENHCIKSH